MKNTPWILHSNESKTCGQKVRKFSSLGILPSLLDIPRINIDTPEFGQPILQLFKPEFNNYLAGYSHTISNDERERLWNHHFVENSCVTKNGDHCLL